MWCSANQYRQLFLLCHSVSVTQSDSLTGFSGLMLSSGRHKSQGFVVFFFFKDPSFGHVMSKQDDMEDGEKGATAANSPFKTHLHLGVPARIMQKSETCRVDLSSSKLRECSPYSFSHAKCGIVTFTQFPHCLTHPSHFHSPKTKVFVWCATVRWLVKCGLREAHPKPYFSTHPIVEADCPTVTTHDVRLVGPVWLNVKNVEDCYLISLFGQTVCQLYLQ